CADLVLAARSASFIQAFAKIGLVPDTGGTWLLPRLVGRARALGLGLLGDKLPAEEAERLGLIWRVVDDAALAEEAQQLARRLAAMPVKALVATRTAFDAAQALDLEAALAQEARMQGDLGRAHDYQEGVAAFGARRAPQFTDR
ncbi:enoyl-CoA hydratase-related protein, partial [Pseudacidovorax intermedius]